jgi:transposase-like protein
MDERLRFVARLLDGEAMCEVCRAFGISRKTGYKIFERYKEHGLEALTDRSRRPVRYANQLPSQIESLIVAAKREKPHWGARKIRELLVRRLDATSAFRPRARSTPCFTGTAWSKSRVVRGGGDLHRNLQAGNRSLRRNVERSSWASGFAWPPDQPLTARVGHLWP